RRTRNEIRRAYARLISPLPGQRTQKRGTTDGAYFWPPFWAARRAARAAATSLDAFASLALRAISSISRSAVEPFESSLAFLAVRSSSLTALASSPASP